MFVNCRIPYLNKDASDHHSRILCDLFNTKILREYMPVYVFWKMTSALYNFKMLCIVLESVLKTRAIAALAREGNRFNTLKAHHTPDAKSLRDAIFVISEANKFVPREKLENVTMTG